MVGLPIFRDGEQLFFNATPEELSKGIQALAAEFGMLSYDHLPTAKSVLRRVAEVVVQPVDDPAPYLVEMAEPEAVGKPSVGRAPDAEPGKMVIQSLIFDREKFSPEEARAWLKDHEGFGDYGVDETQTSYRYRQYDPEHFSRFRTRELADGIVAVMGVVKGDGSLALAVLQAEVHKADGPEADPEEHFVLSLVLEPNDGTDGAPMKPDTQGDIYSASEIRQTAHGWMEKGGKVDLGHDWRALGKSQVRVVESYLAPVTFELNGYTVQKGSWLLGLRVLDDGLWQGIKSGKIGAYSVGGSAVRKPVEAA